MIPEQKQRLTEIRELHPAECVNYHPSCVARFLLSLLDQAQRDTDRVEKALENIISQQPCMDGGSCFYPMHDGDGNCIGEQNLDPLSVIQSMATTAREALDQAALARGEGKK